MVSSPEDVLDFWFGQPATTPDELMAKVRRWFRGGVELDRDVGERFGDTVKAALAGKLDAWAETMRGRLALVIVLDQFTRNVFRNNAKTYAGDEKAQALVVEAFDRKLDEELGPIERLFLSMPLLHSEKLEHQKRVSAIAKENAKRARPVESKIFEMNLEQAVKYEGIVSRFGRFPHRNAILGRTSTPEEIEFLKDWAERQPPAGVS